MKSLMTALVCCFAQYASAQYVGVGTTEPRALVHTEDGNVLFYSSGFVAANPASFTPPSFGRIFLWQVNKGALRNGFAFPEDLDESLMGNFSFATGQANQAGGQWSAAIGYGNQALESGTIAIGYQSVASGPYTFAAGFNAHAAGESAIGLGDGSIAAGDQSFAAGFRNYAYGRGAIAAGYRNTAWSYGSFTAGLFNDSARIGDPLLPVGENRIFQVGNGLSESSRSNALTILQNGNTGIGVLSPAEKLSVAGNGQFTGNLSVQNGKGLIRNNSGLQLKKLSTTVAVNTNLDPGQTHTVSINWPEPFSGQTESYIGNIVSGLPASWAPLNMHLAEVTDNGGVLYIYNPTTQAVNAAFSVKVIAVGGQ